MNNKKYFITLLLLVLIPLVAIQFLVNIVVDPDMETRLTEFAFNRRKFSHTTVAAFHNFKKLNKEKAIVVFGTSRSHMIKSEDFGKKVLNMHAVYGNPYGVRSFLTQLNSTQLENIEAIYYLIDDLTFNGKSTFDYVNFNNPLLRIWKIITSTNINKILRAIETIKRNSQPVDNYLSENGSFIFEKKLPVFNPEVRTHTDPSEVVEKRQVFTEDTFIELGKIKSFAKERNIKIIFFTAPLTIEYIKAMSFSLFVGQRERFLTHLGGYYELAYIDGVSNNHNAFTDFSHTNEFGKEKYLEILKKEDPRFFMTKEKFEQFKAKISRIKLD